MKNLYIIICTSLAIQLTMSTTPKWKDRFLESKKKIVNSIPPGTYDARIRPPGINGTGPVIARINMYVRSISNIDDVKMEYDIQLTFRQSWIDKRLEFDKNLGNYLTLREPKKIWSPDMFFNNERRGRFHDIMVPNHLLRIYPDGTVLSSRRISLTLSCPMDLRSFPMDNQICSIILASYGYTTEDLVLLWKEVDPVQMTKKKHLPKFTLKYFYTDYCTSRTNTGEYGCLKVDFLLTRELGYYMQRIFIPTVILILLSWIPFWLYHRSTTLRMIIAIVVLLAMFIEVSSINASNPPASYTKAVDVWTATCLIFVLCSFIMLCISINFLRKEILTNLKDNLVNDEALSEKFLYAEDEIKSNIRSFKLPPLKWLNRYNTKAQRMDVICRILFPAFFGFFNLVYWFTYTAQK